MVLVAPARPGAAAAGVGTGAFVDGDDDVVAGSVIAAALVGGGVGAEPVDVADRAPQPLTARTVVATIISATFRVRMFVFMGAMIGPTPQGGVGNT